MNEPEPCRCAWCVARSTLSPKAVAELTERAMLRAQRAALAEEDEDDPDLDESERQNEAEGAWEDG